MPTRIRKFGSGGGGGAAGNLKWGPDFGGTDGDQFQATAQAVMDALDLDGNVRGDCTISLFDVAPSFEPVLGSGAITLFEVGVEGTLSGRAQVAELRYITGQTLASKDCWVPNGALCPDDTNKNLDDLWLSTLTTGNGPSDVYIGFDLSMFPAAATVLSASLTLNETGNPSNERTINLFKLTNAGEAWDETTIKCSTRPGADGASLQSIVSAAGGADQTYSLNSSWLTRLDDRMGSASVTFLLQMANTSAFRDFEDKDEGTNNHLGPRLTLDFTVPVV